MAASASVLRPVDDRQEPLFGDDFLETLEYLHIIARKILSGQMKAERRSRQKGVSVEFADHRPYSPGDDFRFIDWNVFFRTDHLFLKLFEEEEDLYIYILLDCSGSVDFGRPYKFHYLRRLAAAIGYLGLASLDRVHVIPIGQSLPRSAAQMLAVRGKGKVFRLLHFLENLRAGGPTNLTHCLKTFAGSKRKRGLAVVLSDCYDPGVTGALNALRYQKFEVFVVHCISPQEAEPELLGDLRLLDAETGRFREVTLTEGLLRRYRQTFGDWCRNLEQFCRKSEVGYVRCRTDQPFQDVIVRMLRREKFLQ
ncbi:MAG TPA: DUF58 domain-containing protein [Verrucomicrobia bacterium]|nr:DUF58 domain-containing protein [Verrucomicrobiota bacterium]HOB31877.1 DUF58 domain-containing protein [Verrucomicrobiota bacterium]HOP97872.1 DUF58 domain-containing protein [Verrucomicrobiota bacterium]